MARAGDGDSEASPSTASLSVLVVDDNGANLLAMEAVLEELGVRICSARSGEEALERLQERDFVVVLLDVQMPDMDGFATARAIRARPRSALVPILFVTAYEQDPAEIALGYSLGASDFLFKPVHPQIVRAKVAVFVNLAEQAAQLRAHEEQARMRALTEARQRWEAEALRQQMEQQRSAAAALQRKAEELARTVRDLEEAQSELVRMNRALEDADRRKNEALALVAHELRNPLAAIATSVSLLQTHAQLAGAFQRACALADRQTRHLSRVVEDLVDVARIQAGQLELRREVLCADDVVADAIAQVRSQIDELGHKLIVAAGDAPQVLGDPVRLAQIVANLLTNAARYTDRQGQIEVSVQRVAERVEFRVCDNGRGISPETMARIFEPFARPKGSSAGLGLGLALVQRLTELHGGHVRAYSAGEGHGSQFIVALPAHADVTVEG
jgi:two-component system, sensor histidine kinase